MPLRSYCGSGEGLRWPSGGMSSSLSRIFRFTTLSSSCSSLTRGSLLAEPWISAEGSATCRRAGPAFEAEGIAAGEQPF